MSTKSLETPYPTFLELIRLVASALDLKNSNKKLDDKARSKHVNPFELQEIIKEVLYDPLEKKFGEDLSDLSSFYVNEFYKRYHFYIATFSADGLTRDVVYPLLISGYLSSLLNKLVLNICKEFNGPNPALMLDNDSCSIEIILNWLDETEDNWLEIIKSMSKENRDRVAEWRRGSDLPSAQSIQLLAEWCEQDKLKKTVDWTRIYALLVMGRALDYIRKNDNCADLLGSARRAMFLGRPEQNFPESINKKKQELEALYEPVMPDVELLMGIVLGADLKTSPDNIKLAIFRYRNWLNENNRMDVHGYLADWVEAKLYIYSGDLISANQSYERAFDNGIYKVGYNIKLIIEEGFVVASSQKKPDKVFLKKLKWASVLFGYDLPSVDDGGYTNNFEGSVELWEIESATKAFWRVFDEGSFLNPGVKDKYIKLIGLPGGINVVFDDIRPDFRNPDRVIKVGSIQRKMPQLVYFVMFNKYEEVKRLIDLGADVNACSEVGESAIMLALGSLNPSTPFTTLDRSIYDIVVECEHKPETLNLCTHKKKLTALMEAVQAGQPEIVQRIIGMGANPDLRNGVEQQTPLNEVLKMLSRLSDPESFRKHCEAVEMSSVSLDGMRRNLPGIVYSMDEAKCLLESLNSSESYAQHKQDFHEIINERISKCWQRDKLIKIAKILIDSGSDVNAVHKFLINGYTPLMLAAELDEVEIFEYMLDHGGDPKKSYYKPDSQSYDCHTIAKEWGSKDVLSVLKDRDVAP